MPITVRDILDAAAYYEVEIERHLDPANPSFLAFDPVLGYTLRTHVIKDGTKGTECSYQFESPTNHRQLINCADQPCRLNTYGDSFTLCAQVSDGETWQEVLAAHLREPIRNYGVGGYGVYQAYRKAMQVEETEHAAGYLILNVWEDDHLRNLDAARWNRVGWKCRDLPRGRADGYPVHGFPWAHVRYDLEQGKFVERPGMLERAEDLRRLVGKEAYYETFKDDPVVHLYTLAEGGEAPVDELEQVAAALGVTVDLRTPATRTAEALRLHRAYGMKSTMYIVDQWRAWAEQHGRQLMVLLSYDVPTYMDYLATGERWDGMFTDYLAQTGLPWVDTLALKAEEYKSSCLDIEPFLERFYIERAGAQVFGHYRPYGNFWFAFAIRDAIVDWLDPKPAPYR